MTATVTEQQPPVSSRSLATRRRARTFRPMAESDGPALVRFHEALSADAQRSRFFGIHPHLSAAEVDRFSRVDHNDREAIVVTDGNAIVAVGRYDRVPATRRAEVAFVTAEDHRREGLAGQLLARLAIAARAVGIVEFVAQTLPENQRMLGVFTRSPFATSTRFGGGIVDISMLLTEPALDPVEAFDWR